ncbi:MAG: two-component system QseEF-associated lipoprotein QseG [Enterobacteriaceae bacterium]|jgi:hypothetical protein|nr:two-component system QseEF-associated lipoprotein QseG [Enterobacteriaceae bacterium]
MIPVSENKLRRALAFSMLVMPLALTGCHHSGLNNTSSGMMNAETPNRKVSDYSQVNCDGNIWQHQNDEVNANSLYWLRLIDCARTLSPSQARVMAYNDDIIKWDGVLKRAILLSRVETSSAERRNSLEQLKSFRILYPDHIAPLIHIWNDKQTLELNLSDERIRNQRFKESNDVRFDALQEQLQETKHQLHETTRKLENLTDIERQLSSRKLSQSDVKPVVSETAPETLEKKPAASESAASAPTQK